MANPSKIVTVRQRIANLEETIAKAQEYLADGSHANWRALRPWFTEKIVDGKPAPPHKDWVRSTFIPRCERALRRSEKILDQLESNSLTSPKAGGWDSPDTP